MPDCLRGGLYDTAAFFAPRNFMGGEPEAKPMKENRTQLRYDMSLTARWQGSAANQYFRIGDLSEGGCYVDSFAEVIEGETLLLNIQMPNGGWLELQAVVVHHHPRLGFGVRFANLDEGQRHEIRSLLRLETARPIKWQKTG
jgi:hypothetical protein